MSRHTVGDVYARVIEDVCKQSRVDFEEGGVELATLDKLQSEWQKKLSALKVAQFPWDPKPAPPSETPIPSSTRTPQTQPTNNESSSQPTSATAIKHESTNFPSPGLPSQNYPAPTFPQGQPMTARDRAAMNLHQSYGQRAGPQIAQLQQAGQPQQRVPMPPNSNTAAPPLPNAYIKQEDSKSSMTNLNDYRPDVPAAAASTMKTSQTDGADDAWQEWKLERSTRKELFSKSGEENDRLMREHFLQRLQNLEGGGLLTPLEDRHIPNARSARRLQRLKAQAEDPIRESSKKTLGQIQGDAQGDDDDDLDEDDENAINSDLDDPDDTGDNDPNGEDIDQVMLCTYDKVQRVKTKWKCTLKDGVLRVEGNEYVFHKGQGEFEW